MWVSRAVGMFWDLVNLVVIVSRYWNWIRVIMIRSLCWGIRWKKNPRKFKKKKSDPFFKCQPKKNVSFFKLFFFEIEIMFIPINNNFLVLLASNSRSIAKANFWEKKKPRFPLKTSVIKRADNLIKQKIRRQKTLIIYLKYT